MQSQEAIKPHETLLDAEEMVLNMGPQHPSTHGVLRVILKLDGETVTDLDCDIGYLHRGVEKIAEHDTYQMITPYWDRLDTVTIIGTALGIKGASMDASVPDKIRQARKTITERGLTTEIETDGGIRRNTVPLIHQAGADYIVPGSLMFGEDPPAMRAWLASLA